MLTVAIRLALCGAVAYAAWYLFGAEGLVYSAPLIGITLAKPILDVIGGAYGLIRSHVYRNSEGRLFSYKGIPIDAVEDDRKYRWLRLSDVRAVLPHLPRDETLRRILGSNVSTVGPDRSLRVKAEALHEYLADATVLESAAFRGWIEKSVIYPSRKARGIDETLAP